MVFSEIRNHFDRLAECTGERTAFSEREPAVRDATGRNAVCCGSGGWRHLCGRLYSAWIFLSGKHFLAFDHYGSSWNAGFRDQPQRVSANAGIHPACHGSWGIGYGNGRRRLRKDSFCGHSCMDFEHGRPVSWHRSAKICSGAVGLSRKNSGSRSSSGHGEYPERSHYRGSCIDPGSRCGKEAGGAGRKKTFRSHWHIDSCKDSGAAAHSLQDCRPRKRYAAGPAAGQRKH